MVRIKRGVTASKRKKSLLQKVKGFRWGRSTKFRQAKEAWLHAGNHAFAHRRKNKGNFRRLWNIRVGAASKAQGISYSQFIHKLKQNNIMLNRKMLSEIAQDSPKVFEKIVERVK